MFTVLCINNSFGKQDKTDFFVFRATLNVFGFNCDVSSLLIVVQCCGTIHMQTLHSKRTTYSIKYSSPYRKHIDGVKMNLHLKCNLIKSILNELSLIACLTCFVLMQQIYVPMCNYYLVNVCAQSEYLKHILLRQGVQITCIGRRLI